MWSFKSLSDPNVFEQCEHWYTNAVKRKFVLLTILYKALRHLSYSKSSVIQQLLETGIYADSLVLVHLDRRPVRQSLGYV